MKKRRLVWVITSSVAVVAVVIILSLSGQDGLQVGKAKIEKLPQGQVIMVDSRAERFGVQLGDTVLYFVDVLYDPEMVSEIDKSSMDESVKLEPFEIRDMQETDFKLDDSTRIYRRQYEIQLINGDVDYLYEFPSIVVSYKPADSGGYMEVPGTAEPVYVASRLPDDIEDIGDIRGSYQLGDIIGDVINSNIDLGYYMLRPLNGEILSIEQNPLPWILIAVGGLLVIGMLADSTLRVIPQRKEEKEKAKTEKNKPISQAYNSLYENRERGVSTENILYQIDHIVRIVLVQNEDMDWLEEMNTDLLPPEIRETVISLFEKTQKTVKEGLEQQNVEESLESLDKILDSITGGSR
jgi:hypothetical protein